MITSVIVVQLMCAALITIMVVAVHSVHETRIDLALDDGLG
jgi:hypothetical protein